jgi:hypothetical protein
MPLGFYLNGKFCPLMMGGSGEEGGTAGGTTTGLSTESFSPESYQSQPVNDTPAADETTDVPESDDQAEADPEIPSELPAWLTDPQYAQLPAFQQAQGQQDQQGQEPPQQLLQRIEMAQYTEEQQVRTALQFLPEAEQRALWQQHQFATQQRQLLAQRAQFELERAQIEAPAREVLIDRMVSEVKRHYPDIDVADAREFIGSFGEGPHGSGASMLVAAQTYVKLQKSANLKERHRKGTDNIGGSGPQSSADSLKNLSVTDLLTRGYKENARNGTSKRRS